MSPRSTPDPLSRSASSRGEAPVENGPVPGRATPSARSDSSADVNPGEPTMLGSVLPDDLGHPEDAGHVLPDRPRLQQTPKGRRLAKKPVEPVNPLTPEQRLLILDAWQRSGLPAGDFAPLVSLSKHTLYAWKKKFETEGPAGLMDKPRGSPEGSRLPEITKRTILMLKQANPSWGVERISAMLLRGPGLAACPTAIARVLHEAGYELEEGPTKPHPDKPRSFERARPGQLWQTDLFTFVLKRQNRRTYLVAFMDDHSRFITSYGLHT
jgi:transposase